MFRCLCIGLVIQLALGCSTLRAVDPSELRQKLRASREPIGLRAQDGSTVRLDPNTEVRFHLHGGSVTRWVRGGDLWHSEHGLSFNEKKGVYLLQWGEIAGAELRNLSSGKTAAAIAVSAVVVGVVVIAILGSLKGGGGGGGKGISLGGLGGGSSRSRKRIRAPRAPVTRRQLHRRGPGGVHVHVPVVAIAATHHHYHPHPHAVPPTQGLPPPPPPGSRHASLGQGSDRIEVPADEDPSMPLSANAAPVEPQPPANVRAAPLFAPSTRRRYKIQLVASAAAGTEFVRFDRFSGSLYLGMRVRDAFELGGGVRHMLAPLPPSGGEELTSSIVGFGRMGAHLGLGVKKRTAIAMSLDAGSGYNSLLQLKFNIGLRFKPTEQWSIGLFPFTPTFNYYKEDSDFRGALRWTFPTTLEVAFNY